MSESIHKRKAEHIRIALEEQVTGNLITTGFEKVRFVHNALPEIDFNELSIETNFLGQDCRTPFLISSMTGGAQFAGTINEHLAKAAEQQGWSFALGSTRAMIESESFRSSFKLRKFAPTIPIIANLGAVQFNYGFGVEECKRIIDWTESNALVLHLNSIQEVIQPEGNVNFKGLLRQIEQLTSALDIPVGVKEVGWGIDGETARNLHEVGVVFIDVAGAGGTSWSQVEKFRTTELKKIAAEAFAEWGIPTVESIQSVRAALPEVPLVASGGIQNGLEAAKAIGLGADMVGFGRSILKEATISAEEVMQVMQARELELKIAMFGIGAGSVSDLKNTERIII